MRTKLSWHNCPALLSVGIFRTSPSALDELGFCLVPTQPAFGKPGVPSNQAAVHVFPYLEATMLVGIRYVQELPLEDMNALSWGDDVDGWRSYVTFVMTMDGRL